MAREEDPAEDLVTWMEAGRFRSGWQKDENEGRRLGEGISVSLQRRQSSWDFLIFFFLA